MGLSEYRRKRDLKVSREPPAKRRANPERKDKAFVVQKHAASHLHYDLRLELDGVLKSWAIPKGPSLDPHTKRLAVEVEDHPLAYAKFEGNIPKGEYGAGNVIIWDKGTWRPLGNPRQGLKAGNLEFELVGQKLKGVWGLHRMKVDEASPQWLLIKKAVKKKP